MLSVKHVPIECRLAELAPELKANGTQVRMKANEVMTIGRKRKRGAEPRERHRGDDRQRLQPALVLRG